MNKLKQLVSNFSPASMAVSMLGQFLPLIQQKAVEMNKLVADGGMREEGEDMVIMMMMPPDDTGGQIEVGMMGLKMGDGIEVTRIVTFGGIEDAIKSM